MSNTITNIKQAISLDLTTALRRVADAHNITDVDQLAQELLVHLGVVDRVSAPAQPKVVKAKAVKAAPAVAPAPAPEADAESEGTKEKKARTRTVSAKQKKDFMALEGATEENLKTIIKGYKEATQEQIDALMTTDSKENAFILYARSILVPGAAVAPVVAEKKVKAKAPAKAKAKKEKGRVSWNATETKIFKKIVESAGSVISDELKQEFADYVTGKTEEEFAVVALEGHMRAFVDSKSKKQVAPEPEAKAGAGHMTPSEYDAARKGWGKGPEYDTDDAEDEDEDLVEFQFNDETLLKGVVSGKIYRTTTEAGDVQVGVCGQGIFKDVKLEA